MLEFSKETLISEVMENAPEAQPLFMAIGMHCMGCAMASGETIGEACEVHEVDCDLFLGKLNAFVASL